MPRERGSPRGVRVIAARLVILRVDARAGRRVECACGAMVRHVFFLGARQPHLQMTPVSARRSAVGLGIISAAAGTVRKPGTRWNRSEQTRCTWSSAGARSRQTNRRECIAAALPLSLPALLTSSNNAVAAHSIVIHPSASVMVSFAGMSNRNRDIRSTRCPLHPSAATAPATPHWHRPPIRSGDERLKLAIPDPRCPGLR